MRSPFYVACLVLSSVVCGLVSGCAIGPSGAPTADPGVAIQGRVRGGQQAISGAHVYLLAANTTGYGNASVSLLTNVANVTTLDTSGGPTNGFYYVSTGSDGSFSITGDYSCTANTQVYLYALGGNPGSGPNSAVGLMAALGNCPGGTSAFATGTPFIMLNEVSTVAAAYAMAGFATDALHVSSSGTALAATGIANAFANAANLETLATGAALATTPAGNGTVPQTEINTLANILASCVNSTGPSSAACGTLLSNAVNGSSAPTDTATAAINIAHNPAAKVATLYALSVPGPPFAPALSAQPDDFTVALSFTGGGIYGPFSLAVDGVGNVWTANGNSSVSELNGVTGAAISPAGGFTGNGLNLPFSIAIDPSGNAWVANLYSSTPPSTVSVFTPSGGVFTGSPFSGGGLSNQISINAVSPRDIAFDANGNAWIGNLADSVTELNGVTGAGITGSPFSVSSGVASPSGVAVDSAGHVWVSGFGGNTLYELAVSNGAVLGTSAYKAGGLEQPYSIAIDSANDIWLPNQYDPNTLVGFTVSKFTNVTTGSSFSGGGILGPDGVVIDGAGNVWISNINGQSNGASAGLSEMNSSGSAVSPSVGYMSSALFSGGDVGVDGSGNVWVANAVVPVTYASGLNLVEFVGAAVPVVTPVSVAVKTGKIGARP